MMLIIAGTKQQCLHNYRPLIRAKVVERHITLDRTMWNGSICLFIRRIKNLTSILENSLEKLGLKKEKEEMNLLKNLNTGFNYDFLNFFRFFW